MPVRDVRARIARRVMRAGGTVSADVLSGLEQYLELLRRWNRRINLTSLPLEPLSDEAIDRLFVEPIVASKEVMATDRVALDIGSGGGSPAIPLKLCAPNLRMRLVEVKVRKAAFLREVIRQLTLHDVEVENSRFEELLARADLHEAADLMTLRAVRAERRVWTGIQAFLRPGGRVFWFGGGSAGAAEILPTFELVGSVPLSPATAGQMAILRKVTT